MAQERLLRESLIRLELEVHLPINLKMQAITGRINGVPGVWYTHTAPGWKLHRVRFVGENSRSTERAPSQT